MSQVIRRLFPYLLPAALLVLGRSAGAEDFGANVAAAESSRTVIGITAPRQKSVLASVLPGRIAELPAIEGATVRRGEVVVVLDDSMQMWKTEMARASAESMLEVDLTQQRYERARLDLERLAHLRGGDSASSKEYRDATVATEIERITFETARFNREQARRAFEREQATLAEYRIRAPFTGYVVEHLKHVGETVDELAGIVVLAQLDPLLVLLDCPLALSGEVHVGDRWSVQPADPRRAPREGAVTLASRVADGASQTFRVKLWVDNEDGEWMAGMRVQVDFSGEPRRVEDIDGETGRLTESPNDKAKSGATKASYEERR